MELRPGPRARRVPEPERRFARAEGGGPPGVNAGRRTVEGTCWIVVPVRSLTDGKRRLASALGARDRAALVRRMFVHTLETAAAAGPPVLVVSPDPQALALAGDYGAAGLEEPGPIGLNHALALAGREVRERGGNAVLVVSADLPDLEASDLRAMLAPPAAAGRGPPLNAPRAVEGRKAPPSDASVRIAPDGAGTGTNALYVRPPGLLAFAYGERSYRRHLEQARAHGAAVRRVERPGLSFDLDTPDDLERYQRRRGRFHGEPEAGSPGRGR